MIREEIKNIINQAIEQVQDENFWPVFEVPEIEILRPEGKVFGDFSSNVAMKLTGTVQQPPLVIAELIAKNIASLSTANFAKIEAVRPGFINFYLSPKFLQQETLNILKKGTGYGQINIGQKQKIQLEFISANPTGPLTLGNGRGGFYGDVLANVLAAAGFSVKREYFINDAGYQVEVLGHSYRKDEKAQYKGEYLENPILAAKTEGLDILDTGTAVANYILETYIQPTIKDRMKIKFDRWVSEKAIRQGGTTDKVLEILKEKNLTYQQDGATWFRSTEFGDDKDRVLITSAKEDRKQSATYLLPDIAYHYKKFAEDKFDKVIDIWGADHHGYVARLQAAGKALGVWDEKNLKIIIMQLVRLFSGGQEVKMSKRAGTYITLDELLAEIPLDVARWFFLMRSPDTHMDFDLDLAREQSDKNPVYYAQYAYARICSILRKSNIKNYSLSEVEGLALLSHPSELSLIKQLIRLPEIIADTACDYQVHRLPQYALDLVRSFHKFYEECRVLETPKGTEGQPVNKDLAQSRLALCEATRIVLKNVLDLMGINSPEKM